jgi:hypothetical protein
MKAIRAAALAALCAALSACVSPPPPPPPAPVLHKAPVDGTYRGTSTRFQSDSRQCPHPGLVEVVVWDNKFQYKWDYQVYIDATIAADDTIQGSGPGITLVGKRIGHSIDGDITNGVCGLHFTLKLVE